MSLPKSYYPSCPESCSKQWIQQEKLRGPLPLNSLERGEGKKAAPEESNPEAMRAQWGAELSLCRDRVWGGATLHPPRRHSSSQPSAPNLSDGRWQPRARPSGAVATAKHPGAWSHLIRKAVLLRESHLPAAAAASTSALPAHRHLQGNGLGRQWRACRRPRAGGPGTGRCGGLRLRLSSRGRQKRSTSWGMN